jgi:hypothetical protein
MKTFNVKWYHGSRLVGDAVVEDARVEGEVKNIAKSLPVNGRIHVKRLT